MPTDGLKSTSESMLPVPDEGAVVEGSVSRPGIGDVTGGGFVDSPLELKSLEACVDWDLRRASRRCLSRIARWTSSTIRGSI